MKNRRLYVWFGRILGCISILVGVFVIIAGFSIWKPVSESLDSISQGIESTERAIDLLSRNFGTSSSLVDRVTASIRQTSEIVEETHEVLSGVSMVSGDGLELLLVIKEFIAELPSGIVFMLDSENVNVIIEKLNTSHAYMSTQIDKIDSLAARMEPLPLKLNLVASGVDSLASEVLLTEASFTEASENMIRASDAIEKAAKSPIIPSVIFLFGLVAVMGGLYLFLLASVFAKVTEHLPVKESPRTAE